MKHLNCIVVFNQFKDKVLLCKRSKEPYKGLYNFVGGKVELDEQTFSAAYRELWEETEIRRADIRLFRLMDFTYYEQDFVLEIYVGQLQGDIQLKEEVNPLEWLTLSENFADSGRFAGDQNIAHIINVALKYPLEEKNEKYGNRINSDFYSVGIDGCKGGWIAAAICKGELELYEAVQMKLIDKIMESEENFKGMLAINEVADKAKARLIYDLLHAFETAMNGIQRPSESGLLQTKGIYISRAELCV